MKNIPGLLRASAAPLLVYANQKEVASADKIVLNTFRDEDDKYAFVTNVTAPKSLSGSKNLPTKIDGIEQATTFGKLIDDENVTLMRDSEGNDVYMDVELAFDLASETIVSPLTGNQVTIAYPEVAEEDMEEEDDSSEGSEEEDSESEDEESTEDESTEDESSEDAIETVSAAEDMPAEGDEDTSGEMEDDSEEDTSEDDSSEDDSEEMSTDDEEDADVESVKTMDMEVSMLDFADATKNIRLVPLNADRTEIAVFVGETPVGKLAIAKASETASFLYADNGKKLFHTFKDRFTQLSKTGDYSELASLGFTPYTATTKVSTVVDKYIEQEVASIRKEIATERSTGTDRHKRVVSLAMVGVCKGLFDKGNNPLVREVASLLRQSGHLNPELAARRALTTAAADFTKVVFERAEDLATKDDAYINGITDTVKSADFKAADSEAPAEEASNVRPIFGGKEKASDEGFVGSNKETASGNRFASLMVGIGSRKRPL